jgi:CDP-4-dehydro-6-deoxyglucose reductase, E3
VAESPSTAMVFARRSNASISACAGFSNMKPPFVVLGSRKTHESHREAQPRMPTSYTVLLEPGHHEFSVDREVDVLTAALAAGFPLPHSCRAGRCASCKAKLLSGEIAYANDRLPPGIVAAEAARGEVLLCQARPRSDLRIQARATASPLGPACGVLVEGETPLTTGGIRVTLRTLGAAPFNARPGQFIDVETATGECERVAVVAVSPETLDVELHEFVADFIVRIRGPFDSPR